MLSTLFGISTFFSRISSDNKTDFCDALMHSRELEVDNFIIVDSADGLKSFAYDDTKKIQLDEATIDYDTYKKDSENGPRCAHLSKNLFCAWALHLSRNVFSVLNKNK